VSRCQIVHFSLIAADRVAAVLQERFGVAPAEAAFLSLTTEGRLGRAVALSRSKALLNARSDLMNWACDLATAPAIKSFKLAEELRKIAPKMRGGAEDESAESDTGDGRAREPLCRCLDVLASYYRDLLAVRAAGADAPMINVDRRLEIVGAAETRSVADLRRAVDLILHTRRAIERNANAQLAVETLLTQLTA
jgi:DNA polymerase-3 subunit delta'